MKIELPDEALQELVAEHVRRVLADLRQPEAWPEWMDVKTAARYLDAGPERIRKLIASREIPHYQEAPNHRVFFRRSELDDWMSRTRIAPRREPEGV